MLTFESPLFLVLLPLTLLFGHWLLRRRRPAMRYSGIGLVRGLPTGRARLAKWASVLLRCLCVVALILAFANPRTPDLKTRVEVEGISIMFLLDISNSMKDDFGPKEEAKISRLDAAKQNFRLFVAGGESEDGTKFSGRKNDGVGLVTFSAIPRTTCPITLNQSVLLRVLEDTDTAPQIEAGTNIGDAIAEGIIRLRAIGGKRRKVIILLSDGEHNRDGAEIPKPLEAAQIAAKYQIPIYTIDCGGKPDLAGKPSEIKQREDGQLIMEGVAKLTGGKSFFANNASELKAAYEQIDQIEKMPDTPPLYNRYHEYGYMFGIFAAVAYILMRFLEGAIWRRFPQNA